MPEAISYYLNDKYPIVLCTDASDYGIGAFLFQVDEEQKNAPSAFSVRKAHLSWFIIEKEDYAI